MVEWAGLGVAIENGHPAALAAADTTVAGPSEEGVALMLEQLLADNLVGR
jgi:hydroxymethylpyrimidine pyrophosphatase-like HAD family hydrolase